MKSAGLKLWGGEGAEQYEYFVKYGKEKLPVQHAATPAEVSQFSPLLYWHKQRSCLLSSVLKIAEAFLFAMKYVGPFDHLGGVISMTNLLSRCGFITGETLNVNGGTALL